MVFGTTTVQHSSADTVVRVISIKYSKWCLGGRVMQLQNPLTDFQKKTYVNYDCMIQTTIMQSSIKTA